MAQAAFTETPAYVGGIAGLAAARTHGFVRLAGTHPWLAVDRYNLRMTSANDVITIHTDGGARGNPGPAAFAYVLERPGQDDIEEKGLLGVSTNNIAEYTALVKALEHAQKLGGRHVLVHSDSELMVKQMNGAYKVKNENLLPLFEAARKLVRVRRRRHPPHLPCREQTHGQTTTTRRLDDPSSCTILDLEPGMRKLHLLEADPEAGSEARAEG